MQRYASAAGKPSNAPGKIAGLLMLYVFFGGMIDVCAQPRPPAPPEKLAWFVHDGQRERPAGSWQADSLARATKVVLEELQRDGFYLARVDSVRQEGRGRGRRMVMHISRGPEVVISELVITGAEMLPEVALRALLKTREGTKLEPEVLERDLAAVLAAYVDMGYGLASITLPEVALASDGAGLRVHLAVEEGAPLILQSLELIGVQRTGEALVSRLAGIRPGALLVRDLDEIRLRLDETGLFTRVDRPELVALPDGGIGMRIGLEEASPGVFDLVLGYQPARDGSRNQGLVGNGRLELRNPFGAGRVAALRLNRLPGQISQLDASYRDPFLIGTPIQLEMAFNGLQQDSTFGQQRYTGALGYRLAAGLDVLSTLSREVTRPGFSGTQLVGATQRIARAEVLFAGATVRYRRVDRALNPRRGISVETRYERGRKTRDTRVVSVANDTSRVVVTARQERLFMQGRAYVPTFARQLVVLGGEAGAVRGAGLDESDLLRFGGAQSLRGYDEDRFRGQFVSRGFVEYRYQFDRDGFAFVFFDLGYVDRPALADAPRERAAHPGYGFGFQFGAGMGAINTSFALAPGDAPTEARVHVGLSLGL